MLAGRAPPVGLGRTGSSGSGFSMSGTLALSEDSFAPTPSYRPTSPEDETMKLVSPTFQEAAKSGAEIQYTSSRDPAHPAENILDGDVATYWMSTGLYPQEILLDLGRPQRISAIQLVTTNVRSVSIEGSSELSAVNFEKLALEELEAQSGMLQRKELDCREQQEPTRFVKAKILSGWHDFCSVHSIIIRSELCLASD
eukprot:gb/GFBE01021807.1/.p1 GENE.gb/GFBE01021807.1/~~gb/GFBE01021807.1/.p1  ORF type:complete len:198 (+),score=34.13 gb/GFBE01021807.1/:1-594(+)